MIIACATDDKLNFIDRHFGDAKFYCIFDVTTDSIRLLQTIENTTEEERQHADPQKAKSVMQLLKEEGTQGVINKAFGPNIKPIAKLLVPVITNETLIEDGVKQLQNLLSQIEENISQNRKIYVKISGNNEAKIFEIN